MENAKLIVYDRDWNQVGYIDAYTSLIWSKKFTSYGDFELYLPFKKSLAYVLKLNNFVTIEGKNNNAGVYAMIIERVEMTQSPDNPTMMTVKGRSLLSILYRRVLYEDVIGSFTEFGFIKSLIDSCFSNDESTGKFALPPRRWNTEPTGRNKYAILALGTFDDDRVYAAERGENLGEAISNFCESKGIGIDILYTPVSDAGIYGVYYIYIYKFNGKENDVIFSNDLDNLSNVTYIEDISNYANVARVKNNDSWVTAPRGADSTKDEEYTSFNRYEITFDTDYSGGETGSFSAMQASGIRQLREYATNMEITAEIINTDTYTYEKDYQVGDIVKIITDFGITASAQIVEMTECWDLNGYTLSPTFSNYKILDY